MLSKNKYAAQSEQDTILIVEDDPISSLLLEEFFKNENFRVYSVTNGFEAISFVQDLDKHSLIILMDILMPKMNGAEAAKRIKEISFVPVIIAQTAQTFNLRHYDLSYFDDIITKPIDFQVLKNIINKHKNNKKTPHNLSKNNYLSRNFSQF